MGHSTRARRVVAPALVAAIALLAAGCWTSYGGNPSNSRDAVFERTITPANVSTLHEKWRVSGTVGSTSTPAVFGDVVYFGNWDGTLRAVDATTGTPRWTTKFGNQIIDDSPLVYGNTVYVGDAGGYLHAVDAATGTPRWSVHLDTHPNTRIFSSPVAVDNLIIIGVASVELALVKPDYTFRGSIVALDAKTGAEKWRIYTTTNDANGGAGVSVWSTAAIDRDRKLAFIGTGQTYEQPASPRSDALMAIDYEHGTIKWLRQFTPDDVYTIFGPAPQGPDADLGAAPNLFRIGNRDVVGIGDKAGVYAVLDRETGATVWAKHFGTGSHLGGIMTSAAYHDGTIYLASNSWSNMADFHDAGNTSTTFAIDAATGNVRWQKAIPSAVFGAFTYANGVVFQPSIDGVVYGLDAQTGNQRWSASAGGDLGGGLSVVSGTVFVPYGFWFFAAPPNPNGGIVAYGLG